MSTSTEMYNRNLNLISSDECLKIAKNAMKCNDIKLLEFRVQRASNTVGYLGEYFRLFAHVQQDNHNKSEELQFFVKVLPSGEEHRQYMVDTGIVRKEGQLYTKLMAELQKIGKTKWSPTCYYVRDDIIVLEDISLLGFKHCPHLGNCNWQCLESALQSLAALHAASLAYEKFQSKNIGEEFKDCLFEITVLKECGFWSTGVEAIRNVILKDPRYDTGKYKMFMETEFNIQVEKAYTMVNPSQKYPNVLCHRDTWGMNVFYNSSSPSPAILIDFQTCKYSPSAIDVLFCVYLNTRREIRQNLTEKCLKSYFKAFTTELKSIGIDPSEMISFNSLLDSYEELKLFGVLYNAVAVTVIHIPNGFLAKLKESNPTDYFKYCNVDRAEQIMEFLRTDETFRERLYEAIDELLEVIMTV